MRDEPDWYEILGVSTDADPEEINAAYRKLRHEHPDRKPEEEREKATRRMANINAARDILLDPVRRKEFDEGRKPKPVFDPSFLDFGFVSVDKEVESRRLRLYNHGGNFEEVFLPDVEGAFWSVDIVGGDPDGSLVVEFDVTCRVVDGMPSGRYSSKFRAILDETAAELSVTVTIKASIRPFVFIGTSHFDLNSLADHLANEWDEAVRIVSGRDLEDLAYWFGQFPVAPKIERVLDSCRKKQFVPDRLMAMLIVAMSPGLPPRFRTFAIDRPSLTALASKAAGGAMRERDIIHRLRDSRSLNAFTGLSRCGAYAELDDQWQRNVNTVLSWSRMTRQLRDTLSAGQDLEMEAKLLHVLTDMGALRGLTAAAAGADTENARTRRWFEKFRSNRPTRSQEDLLPAYYWAVIAIAPVAEREYADAVEKERAAESKRAEEVRLKAEKLAEQAKRMAVAAAERERRLAAEKAELERAAAERYARLQQSATDILNDPDGPVNRYRAALEVERTVADSPLGAALHFTEPLAPVPLAGAASEQVVALAALMPIAARRLELVTERATSLARDWRAVADRRVSALKTPAPPVPRPQAPQRPAFDRAARSFRRLSVAALVAVVGAPLVWLYGANAYSGGASVLGDGLRALAGVAASIAGGVTAWLWLASARDGFDRLHRAAAAHASYENAHREYDRQLNVFNRLVDRRDAEERERVAALTSAEAHSLREHQRADAVESLARRSRIATVDILEPATVSRLDEVVRQARSIPAP